MDILYTPYLLNSYSYIYTYIYEHIYILFRSPMKKTTIITGPKFPASFMKTPEKRVKSPPKVTLKVYVSIYI
jgi:hypothetical protein